MRVGLGGPIERGRAKVRIGRFVEEHPESSGIGHAGGGAQAHALRRLPERDLLEKPLIRQEPHGLFLRLRRLARPGDRRDRLLVELQERRSADVRVRVRGRHGGEHRRIGDPLGRRFAEHPVGVGPGEARELGGVGETPQGGHADGRA